MEEKWEKMEELSGISEPEVEKAEEIEILRKDLADLKNKYLRLYADFENYKKMVAKEKEEMLKYSNEELIKEILPVMDYLELALQHSSNEANKALAEGVELTLKEMRATLEKFGLSIISAIGKPFDPSVHHAMAQIESEEAENNTIITEFRKGYMLRERVLRPSLVGVSKKSAEEIKNNIEEE
ncbi:MAG TPA: nucleotide exchange factor GrpE [Nitrospiraceae bacterium]|nr:nucleotide exchange factor GrpE [Nitrospiraceae bacterium]